jgi:hypothetical protein
MFLHQGIADENVKAYQDFPQSKIPMKVWNLMPWQKTPLDVYISSELELWNEKSAM